MLPILNLQTFLPEGASESLNAASLLPQDAVAPRAVFAELLHPMREPELVGHALAGDTLPATGKGLPPGSTLARDIDASPQIDTQSLDSAASIPVLAGPIAEVPERAMTAARASVLPGDAPETLRPTLAAPRSYAQMSGRVEPLTADVLAAPTSRDPRPDPADITRPPPMPKIGTYGEPNSLISTATMQTEAAGRAATNSGTPAPLAGTAATLLAVSERRDPASRLQDRPANSSAAVVAAARPASSELLQTAPAEAQFRSARDVTRPVFLPEAAMDRSVESVPSTSAGLNGATRNGAADAMQAMPRAATITGLPVQDPAWGERLAERVVILAGNRAQNAEIRVTPSELGPIRVQLNVADGTTNVVFHAQHAITREAIEQALPRLRELLAEQGLQLGNADVGERGVEHRQQDRETHPQRVEHADAVARPEDLEATSRTVRTARVPGDGRVDTFV